MVIVKDLSRLGRDHVMTGYYIETYFPENNIRFISIMESYDSMKIQASNDASTFIIASNDYMSRQNSIKIRSILDEKRKNGKFIGSKPSYGYKRDPLDKGHLVIDPEVADYVRYMFDLADNDVGVSDIATKMTEIGAPTPSAYKGTKLSSRLINKNQWTVSTVKKILRNRMYTGDLVQHTQTNVNYKSKKKITLDESLWTIVENTHEPLVDREKFKRVNDRRRNNRKSSAIKTGRPKRLLEGLLICKECSNRLTVNYRKNHDYWTINCNRYSRDPRRKMCGTHFFPYDILEEQILEKIRESTNDAINRLDICELNEIVTNKIINNKVIVPKRTLSDLKSQKDKTIKAIQMLYDDRLSGAITIDNFKELSKPYENKLKEINKLIDERSKEPEEQQTQPKEKDYKNRILKLLDISRNRELLLNIVEYIKIDNTRTVYIKYKYDIFEECIFKYQKPEKNNRK